MLAYRLQLVRGHLPNETVAPSDVRVWNLRWFRGGKPRPNLPSNREKLILRTERCHYMSVHRLTTPNAKTTRLNAEKQVRPSHARSRRKQWP